jgi:predicted metal-dependent peptidase
MLADPARNDYSYRRFSKRFLYAGTYLPSLYSEDMGVLGVGIDTSGSIGEAQLAAFFDEIDAIWRSGARVVIAACDAAVHDVFEYRGKTGTAIGGGGGTAFEPVFVWMRETRGQRFDGVVYLTDGQGPAPETRPPCKLLWVVTDAAGMGEHLRFGRQITLI